jgi:hypothetical protein
MLRRSAQRLAFYSQFPDQTDSLDALALQARQLKMGAAATEIAAHNMPWDIQLQAYEAAKGAQALQVLNQDVFHGLTGRDGAEELALTKKVIANAGSDLALAGLMIHRLGDVSGPHVDENGNTFASGFGHGGHGSTPDIIQRAPGKYVGYAGNLGGQLDVLAGKSNVKIEMTTVELQNELAEVANIPTRVVTNQAEISAALAQRKAWRPLGWMQLGPPAIPAPKYYNRSDKELEELSVAMLKQKINALGKGIDLRQYAPEAFHSSVAETLLSVDEVTPFDVAVATGPRNNRDNSLYFPEAEVRAKVAHVTRMFKAEADSQRNDGKIATEGASGQIELQRKK